MTTLFLFRDDLRLSDHPALVKAAENGPIVPVFVYDDASRPWAMGAARKWWLHHSLAALKQRVPALGFYKGSWDKVVPDVARQAGATRVVWSTRYGAAPMAEDAHLADTLRAAGVVVEAVDSRSLFVPGEILNQSGQPFKVFTPFWKACAARLEEPLGAGGTEEYDFRGVDSGLELKDLGLLPGTPNWAAGWEALWEPGEAGARRALARFVEQGLADYAVGRDYPARAAVSRLSPHLAIGEISARDVVRAVRKAGLGSEGTAFVREVGWREFCTHLLAFWPDMPDRCWKPGFEAYPWRQGHEKPEILAAWQRGQTGYPLVDAGMRELWQTGWMHNRVRMVVASFLIKHLRIDWREGEAWFWDTLVDADLANNAGGWQWVAGCGADASPFFRIFNPTEQARKFDPAGDYIRRFCPELARLPTEHLFAPWEASPLVLAAAGVVLGKDYPYPLVDHPTARAAALAGLAEMRKGGT